MCGCGDFIHNDVAALPSSSSGNKVPGRKLIMLNTSEFQKSLQVPCSVSMGFVARRDHLRGLELHIHALDVRAVLLQCRTSK